MCQGIAGIGSPRRGSTADGRPQKAAVATHIFKNKNLLERALTRKAYAQEMQQRQNKAIEDHEAFSTLGDAILKAILIEKLIENVVQDPGEITSRKRELENEDNLARIFRDLRIGNDIRLGIGEEKQGANKQLSVKAEILEAIIGAIFMDTNYEDTKCIVGPWFAFS